VSNDVAAILRSGEARLRLALKGERNCGYPGDGHPITILVCGPSRSSNRSIA
jgi:hypothetical protein